MPVPMLGAVREMSGSGIKLRPGVPSQSFPMDVVHPEVPLKTRENENIVSHILSGLAKKGVNCSLGSKPK